LQVRLTQSVIAFLTAILLYPCLYAQPTVNFTFNNNVCSGTPVQFTSNVAGGTAPYTYAWTFGGGGSSTAQDPIHAFTSLGCGTATFQNTLTVTDAAGLTGTATLPINILQAPDVGLADANPFGNFSNCANSPSPSNPNFTLTINNNSPSSACITSYTIKWGDASAPVTVAGPTFSLTHTYTTLGAFDLEVTAVSSNGCSNTKKYTVANQTNPDIGLGTVGSTEGCAPLDVTAVISLWQNNSPGTTYQLAFGDGTTIPFSHPINATNVDQLVPHTYLTTSCPNSADYRITITATNGCRSKTFTGGNIVVKSKPQAAFNTPTGQLCAGQSVCFTNQTVAGFWNNCSTTTQYAWDFGDPASGANNTSTQANPCHQYASPGTYTVSLTVNNPCGSSTITKQVCISAPAAPAFDLDASAICRGATVTATNNSNNPGCTTAGYQWTVSYASGFCGTSSSWSFANGTNATSANPSFTFNNPGTYTLSLRMTGACGNAVATKTVTVKAPPTVSLPVIANACGQATVCPVPTVTNCGSNPVTYAWLFDGGAAGSSTDANPGCINFTGAGVHTVSLTVTNECGSATATRQFTINPGADINVPSTPPPLCAGEIAGPFTFTSTTPGATITWTNSSPGIGLPASGSGNIGAFTTNNATGSPIVANIIVSATSNGCSAQSGFNITVNPKPAAPSVASPVAYCVNDAAVPLTANATAGNTLQWYTTPTGGSGSTTAPTPVTTTAGSTSYYVSQKNDVTGCEGNRAVIVVNVGAVPAITNASGTNPATCASSTGSISLAGLSPNTTYSVRYTKNAGAPTVVNLTSNASGVVSINGLSAGTYTDISVNLGICASNVTGPVVLTDPNPPAAPTATANGPKCAGDALSLFATTVAGGSYAWTGPNGFTSSAQNPTINNVGIAANGTYSVTVTVNNCRSAASTVDVVIHPRPAAPTVNGNINICNDGTINLTASTNFAGTVTYSWTGPNGFTSSQQNPVITNATAANTGVYNVTVTSTVGSCESPAASTSVTVSPVPAITNSSGSNPTACGSSTGSISLTGLFPNTTYSVRYIKNGGAPTVVNLTSNASGIVIINGLSAGTYIDINVSLGICASNITGPVVLTDPNPPAAPSATSNGPKCAGEALNLFTPTVAGGSYAWTGPNGFASTAQNPTINNVGLAANGTYSVTVTVNNCRSAAGTIDVVIHPRPAAPTVPANINVCNNGTLNLTASTNFAGAVTYSWTGPNAFTSTQQNPVISNVTPANIGVYTVTITSVLGSCQSPSSNTTVTVLPVPVITSSSHINPIGCGSSTGIILLNGLLPSTSYTVSYVKNGVPAIVLLTSNAAGTIFVNNLSAGLYTNVTASLNGCVSNIAGPFTLNDTPPFSVVTGSNGPLCEGGTLVLNASATSTGSATYSWTGPNGFASILQNPVINNAAVINAGVYRVTITINSCSATDSITVAISKPTIGGNIGPDATVCRGKNSGTLFLTGQLGLVTGWEFSINNGASWNNINNTGSFLNYKDVSVSTLYRARVQNGACAAVYSTTARVNVLNTVDTVSLQPAFINTCNHDTVVTFTANALYTGTDPLSYKWFINGQLSSNTNPFVHRFNPATNHQSPLEYNIQVLAENSFGCGDTSVAGKVIVQPLPVPGIQVTPGKIQLQPNYTFTFRDTSFASANKLYTWNMGDKLSQTRLGREVTFSYSDTGVYKVRLFVLDRATNCTAIDSVTVQVIPVKGTLFVPNAFYPNSKVNELKTFKLKGTGLAEFHLQIFDTWGKLIFETKELTPDGSPSVAWDGTYMNSGQPLPHDAYVWKVVKAKFKNGKDWDGMSYNGGQPKRFGNVTLFR
jgi:large repetitive protein